MKLFTNSANDPTAEVGIVDLASIYLNDRKMVRWSKHELITFVSKEQEAVGAAMNRLYETHFISSATTTTVADQSIYAMPAELVNLLGVEIGDTAADKEPQEMVEIHYTDRRFYDKLQSVNSKRDFGFFFVRGRSIELKTPDPVGGRALRIFYVERLVDFKTDNSDDSTISKIPLEHHEIMSIGAAMRAGAKINRVNVTLERMYDKRMQLLDEATRPFSVNREERRGPFYGTYGPNPVIDPLHN